jgi:hypothetical protein
MREAFNADVWLRQLECIGKIPEDVRVKYHME